MCNDHTRIKIPRGSPVTIFSVHMYHCLSVMPLTDYSDVPKITGTEKTVSVSVMGCFPAVINSRKAEEAVILA